MHRMTIQHNGVPLEIEYTSVPGETATAMKPAIPHSIEIEAVYFLGGDVMPILSSDCLTDIERSMWRAIERRGE